MDSILISIKKLLGLTADYEPFDPMIIVYINSALMAANQIGVGVKGFTISGSNETWDQFIPEAQNLEAVKTFVYLKVRIVFDPPTSSIVMDAIKSQIDEYTWRLNVEAETPISVREAEENQNE